MVGGPGSAEAYILNDLVFYVVRVVSYNMVD